MRKKIERPKAFSMRITTDEDQMIRALRADRTNISAMFREYLGFQYLNLMNRKNRR